MAKGKFGAKCEPVSLARRFNWPRRVKKDEWWRKLLLSGKRACHLQKTDVTVYQRLTEPACNSAAASVGLRVLRALRGES